MAQACNNIGKELTSSSSEQKSSLPSEGKKSLKRTISRSSVSPPTKKISGLPSSSFMFNSLVHQNLNKTFDYSSLSTMPFNSSAFSPTFPRSSYLMDSILSSPYVCNWIDSIHADGFCGKRFTNHFHLFEHLCTEHSSIKSSYPSYYSSNIY